MAAGRVPPGCLAAPADPLAGRSRCVRRGLDSTVVRAHMSAAGAPKNQETEPELGRSRGGFGTQIHILADRRRLRVTGGQRHDRT